MRDLVKKGSPRLSDRIELASKWIARGYYACAVALRIVGINEATYSYRKMQEAKPQRNHTSQSDRPIPEYAWTSDRQQISDEQIKEWQVALAAGEESE